MGISRQKIYATLRNAGYTAAKFNRSGTVRGWGSWTSGVEVIAVGVQGIDWKVEYNFGERRVTSEDRIKKLQEIREVLIVGGIQCYPNTHETALIIGNPNEA